MDKITTTLVKSASGNFYVSSLNADVLGEHTQYASGNAMAICVKGWARGEVNMQECMVTEGCVTWVFESFLVRCFERSEDFEVLLIGFANGIFADLALGVGTDVMFRSLRTTTAIEDPEIRSLILNYVEQARTVCTMPDFGYNDQILGMIVRSVLLIQYNGVIKAEKAQGKQTFSSADTFAYNFMELLRKYSKQEHEVSFYASQLGVTPKYLNEVTQSKLHKKAKDVVSRFVVSQLRREIVYSGKSIKTIAYEYNFSDQSSLGKFFKKHTGKSPAEFRRQHGTGTIDDDMTDELE